MARVRTHTNPLHLIKRLPKLDLNNIFENHNGKIDLEIGFGYGVFLRHYAKLFPQRNIVGVEVRQAIVEIFVERLAKEQTRNVLPIHSTAQICLEDIIPDNSIENVFIFHPDPWFKKRHYKRRVVNTELLQILSTKMLPTGKIYISTDVAELFADIEAQFAQLPQFTPTEDPNFWETTYKTHWNLFSIQDNRQEFFRVYTKIDR